MPPFPYKAPGLTFRQFADFMRQTGTVEVVRLEAPTGDGTECLYRFTNTAAEGCPEVTQHVGDDSWPMMASTFRSLCARLRVDPDFLPPIR